jgi:hypothetical protein
MQDDRLEYFDSDNFKLEHARAYPLVAELCHKYNMKVLTTCVAESRWGDYWELHANKGIDIRNNEQKADTYSEAYVLTKNGLPNCVVWAKEEVMNGNVTTSYYYSTNKTLKAKGDSSFIKSVKLSALMKNIANRLPYGEGTKEPSTDIELLNGKNEIKNIIKVVGDYKSIDYEYSRVVVSGQPLHAILDKLINDVPISPSDSNIAEKLLNEFTKLKEDRQKARLLVEKRLLNPFYIIAHAEVHDSGGVIFKARITDLDSPELEILETPVAYKNIEDYPEYIKLAPILTMHKITREDLGDTFVSSVMLSRNTNNYYDKDLKVGMTHTNNSEKLFALGMLYIMDVN